MARNKREPIIALYADENGEIFDAPGILAMGREGDELRLLTPEDLIPLPESADLMLECFLILYPPVITLRMSLLLIFRGMTCNPNLTIWHINSFYTIRNNLYIFRLYIFIQKINNYSTKV